MKVLDPFQFWVIKTMDPVPEPDPDSLEMLDPQCAEAETPERLSVMDSDSMSILS
jgi:hypothetical protein